MTAPQLAAEQAAREEFADELKPGTKLLQGQYTITRFINSGGFGITYLAKDSLDRDVVIKECFPGNFCRRSDTIVGARSRAHQAEFKSIVKLFVQEARSLAKLVHPNIVGVHQVFEDNDTAYMAIDFIDGRDLLDMIENPKVEIAPAAIVEMTHKLLKAIGFIHDNGILHRDISPDNILVNKTGEPILIDFGAAREEATRKSRALSALRVVKDGYSPQEFYIAGSEQGPWSDLYALAATLYHTISGEPPANSQVRLAAIAEGANDPYEQLAGRYPGYPVGFLEAIDKAMHAVPRRRIQSAGDWLEMLANPAQSLVESDPMVAVSRLLHSQIPDEPQPVVLAQPEAPEAEPVKPAAPFADLNEPQGEPDGSGGVEGASKDADTTAEQPQQEAKAEPAAASPALVADAHVHPTRISIRPAPEPLPKVRGGSGRGLLMGLSAVAVLAVLGFVVLRMGETEVAAPEPETPAPAQASETSTTSALPLQSTASQSATTTSAAAADAQPVEAEGSPAPQAAAATVGNDTTVTSPVTSEDSGSAMPDLPEAAETPLTEGPDATPEASPEAATEAAPAIVEYVAPEKASEDATAADAGTTEADATSEEPSGSAESSSDAPEAAASEAVTAPEAEVATVAAQTAEVETAAAVAEDTLATDAGVAGEEQTSEPDAAAVEQAAEAETVVAEPIEVAAAEPAAPATLAPLADMQVTFAVWDVIVPFKTQVRSVGGVNYATIRSIDESTDFSIAGDWIQEGTTIFSVNGNPVSRSQNVGALILRNLTVERDGMARASVRIKLPGDNQYNRVQLAVPVLRRTGLAGGLMSEARFVDDQWQVVVRDTGSAQTTLRAGDVILSETQTGTALDHADSLEDLIARLAASDQRTADFEILRNGTKTNASYSLATQ